MIGMNPVLVTYTPRTGAPRSIEVLIQYVGPRALAGIAGGSRPHLEILVRNHATLGITSRQVDTGGDKLTLPLRIGRVDKIVRIVEIIAQDRAMLRLLCY